MTISKENAYSLAIAYQSYMEACDKNDDLGICVWGELLLEAQDACGVRFLSSPVIRTVVEAARRRRDSMQRSSFKPCTIATGSEEGYDEIENAW